MGGYGWHEEDDCISKFAALNGLAKGERTRQINKGIGGSGLGFGWRLCAISAENQSRSDRCRFRERQTRWNRRCQWRCSAGVPQVAGTNHLFELWNEIKVSRKGRETHSPVDQLRNLLIRLSENWDRYCTFYWQNQVAWTNNGSEQVIGKVKIQSKTVRGFKSEQGMLKGLMLAGSGLWWYEYLVGERGSCPRIFQIHQPCVLRTPDVCANIWQTNIINI